MDRGIAVTLMALTGGLVAMQPAVNSGLGKVDRQHRGRARLVPDRDARALAIIVGLAGQAGGVGEATGVPWYLLLGGVLGAAYVFTALVTVSSIGAGGVAAATITGQLTFSVILDRIGFLGLEETPITLDRVLGVALLLAGTFLIVR